MDIRELKYFIEIAKELNFTKAANQLFISQPSLSMTIKKMEQSLGIKLIERNGNKILLTDCGESLYRQAENIIASFDNIQQSFTDIQQLKTGNITVGIPSTFLSLYLADVILDFKNRYPGIDINIAEESGTEIIKHVLNGKFDFGYTMPPVYSDELTTIPLFHEEMAAIMPSAHYLSHQETIRFEDLKNQTLHLYNSNYIIHEQSVSRCKNAGFEPKIACTSAQGDFLVKMAIITNGVAILPRPLVMPFQNHLDISIRPFNPPFPWTICVIYRKDKYVFHAAKELIVYSQEYFNKITEPQNTR